MKLSNAIICTEVESTPKGLNFKGVFSEIVKDPIPSAIDCSVVITLERLLTDEAAGTPKQLRIELIHRPSGRFLLLGQGTVTMPDPSAQVVIKIGSLLLNGLGDYYVRATDTTDSQHPTLLLDEKLLFTVKSTIANPASYS